MTCFCLQLCHAYFQKIFIFQNDKIGNKRIVKILWEAVNLESPFGSRSNIAWLCLITKENFIVLSKSEKLWHHSMLSKKNFFSRKSSKPRLCPVPLTSCSDKINGSLPDLVSRCLICDHITVELIIIKSLFSQNQGSKTPTKIINFH